MSGVTRNVHYENAASPHVSGSYGYTPENEGVAIPLHDLVEATLAVAFEARTANLLTLNRDLRDTEVDLMEAVEAMPGSNGNPARRETAARLRERRLLVRREILVRLDVASDAPGDLT